VPTATRRARHRSSVRPRAARPGRSLWLGAGLVSGAVVLALATTGGTYALWNGSVAPTTQQVRSGTASLVVSGSPSLRAPLGPGASIATSFTATNSGDVPLALRVAVTRTTASSGADGAGSGALGELTLHVTKVASPAACTTSVVSGPGARLASLDTGASWATVGPASSGGSSAVVSCLVLTLDADAPQATAGAVVDLVLSVTGTQVLS
jgi:hypothetical protein